MSIRLAAFACVFALTGALAAPGWAQQTPPAAKTQTTKPAPAKPAATKPPPFVKDARAIVQKYVDNNQFSGTVLVAKDGKPILREGFGYANRELEVKAKPETVFRLGSITKQFTSASIMQLAEQGKLSIDDPISKYYDKAPAAWSKVTLKHLLSHRSGIPSYTDQPGFMVNKVMIDLTPDQLIELTRDLPLQFEPGSSYRYDNSGYILLGYVIEKVSGQKYADYLQEHIFTPLGMRHSGYDVASAIIPNRATGYTLNAGQWRNSAFIAMTLPYAAGSLYSTLDDLLIWEDALYADKVVSKASRELMSTDYGQRYGFGLGFGAVGDHKWIGHGGGINGFSTFVNRFPADGVTVVVLSNLQSAPSSRIADDLARAFFGVPAPPPPAPLTPLVEVAVPAEVLDRYVGYYKLDENFILTFKREGAKLTSQATGQNSFTMTATGQNVFQFQPARIIATFAVDGDKPSPSVTVNQGGQDRIAPRVATPNG